MQAFTTPSDNMVYSEAVREHFDRPRNSGSLSDADGAVYRGSAGKVETGARVEIDLTLDSGRIGKARFRAFGCPNLIATASWVTDSITGKPVSHARELKALEIAENLGIPHARLGVVLVVEDALLAALDQMPPEPNGD